jgi:hypothetical protein
MQSEGTIEVLVDVGADEIALTVDYRIDESRDAGVRTCRNGDPGVPSSCERSVSLINSNRELLEMVREVCAESRLAPPDSAMIPRIRQRIKDYILERT